MIDQATQAPRENRVGGLSPLLLVGVGRGEISEQILRRAVALAESSRCRVLAVHVETGRTAEQSRPNPNLVLARTLGAEVITTTDEDIGRGLLRAAAQRGASRIIVGRAVAGPWLRQLLTDRFLRRLIIRSGKVEVHIVPAVPKATGQSRLRSTGRALLNLRQYLAAAGVVLIATLVNLFFEHFAPQRGTYATALIFLLAVVALASFLETGPALAGATLSALVWDYFFLPPRFAFRVNQFEDALLLGLYFVVAIVVGQLTARIRAQQVAEQQREEHATALYLLTRELGEVTNPDQILQTAVERMKRVFDSQVEVLLTDGPGKLGGPQPATTISLSETDRRAALFALENKGAAGRFTAHQPEATGLYLPLITSTGAAGVVGLRLGQAYPPTRHQLNLLEAFTQQVALALERCRLREASEQARLLTESERLAKNLLNSISHEIRTPIAAIAGAAGNLVEFQGAKLSAPQLAMIGEIQEATTRLNRLVGNVLDITRLESGHVKPKLEWCDVRDLVRTAVRDTRTELSRHQMQVNLPPELPLARLDFVLMLQAITNLLSNAAVHTPERTLVRIGARVDDEVLSFIVSDNGPGIPAEFLPRIFDKFYRAPNAPTGGTGLGLSLVKGFVEAHGGQIEAGNAAGGGAVFTIRLRLDKPAPVANE